MSANRTGKRVKKERTLRKTTNNLNVLFVQFRAIKKSEGRAESTLGQYEDNYGFFLEFLDRKGIARSIHEMNRDVIRKYIVYMQDEWVKFEDHYFKKDEHMTKGLAPGTINTRLKTLRVFFKTLYDEGLIEHNPMLGVKNVREPEEEIVILDEDELRMLFAAPNQREYADFRDYVLMNVLLDGMMRISEALGLKQEKLRLCSAHSLYSGYYCEEQTSSYGSYRVWYSENAKRINSRKPSGFRERIYFPRKLRRTFDARSFP